MNKPVGMDKIAAICLISGMDKSAAFERGIKGLIKALKIHADPKPFIQRLSEHRFDQWDLIRGMLSDFKHRFAGQPIPVEAAVGRGIMQNDAANAAAKYSRSMNGTPQFDRAVSLYKYLADKALKRDAIGTGIGLGATAAAAGGAYGANKLLAKEAADAHGNYGSIDAGIEKSMLGQGAPAPVARNYRNSRESIWKGFGWNPFDWLYFKNYVSAEQKQDVNREAYLDKMRHDRYWAEQRQQQSQKPATTPEAQLQLNEK